MLKGLDGLSSKENLSTLGFSSLEERMLRGNLSALCSFLEREGEREMLCSSPWAPVQGMVQSCIRGDLD